MLSLRGLGRQLLLLVSLAVGGGGAAQAALVVQQGEYKLPAAVDTAVATGVVTELWAKVYRPVGDGPYPLLVFLHGNHGTCGRFDAAQGIRIDDRVDYTTSGTCPAGYVPTPNHLGYAYLAEALAAQGYVVVSINANRGVNAAAGVSGDFGLNLRRGRLVLRHMEELAKWHAGTATPPAALGFSLQGVLDFSHVGLMGHSRGGEGMRAAVAQYRDAGSIWPGRIGAVGFEALYEIGPVDGQTGRVLNATGLAWNVLLPGCDGDVSDLQGVKPLDRMFAIRNESADWPKSSFQVFGANHNFYNTEWQQSDAGSCTGQTAIFPQTVGSADQRRTAADTLVPFFRAHVGAKRRPAQAKRFDPSQPLPASLTSITRYARGYTATPRSKRIFVIDDFERATGTSSAGVPNLANGLASYAHGSAGGNHDSSQRAASLSWASASAARTLQLNAAAAGAGVDVSAYPTLEFRIALQCGTSACSSAASASGDVDFSMALVHDDETSTSSVALKSVATVFRPAGSWSNNTMLRTVRVPVSAFAGFDASRFRGLRLSFDRMATRTIYLANVRLTRALAGPGGSLMAAAEDGLAASAAQPAALAVADRNQVVALRRVAVSEGTTESMARAGDVEVELLSSRAFPVGGALPELRIGSERFLLSRFADGATDRLIFTVPAARFERLSAGDPISVQAGRAPLWQFGALSK